MTSLQDNAYNVVATTMGYPASWLPDGADTAFTAKVLFNEPTDDKDKVSEQQYVSPNPQMEYKQGNFPGLYEAIRSSNGGQEITINGMAYIALIANRKYDGKTIIVDVIQAT